MLLLKTDKGEGLPKFCRQVLKSFNVIHNSDSKNKFIFSYTVGAI